MLDGGASETAAIADINRDGRLDIVSGESWYEAPAWRAHRYRELDFRQHYVDSFSDLARNDFFSGGVFLSLHSRPATRSSPSSLSR